MPFCLTTHWPVGLHYTAYASQQGQQRVPSALAAILPSLSSPGATPAGAFQGPPPTLHTAPSRPLMNLELGMHFSSVNHCSASSLRLGQGLYWADSAVGAGACPNDTIQVPSLHGCRRRCRTRKAGRCRPGPAIR